MGYSRLLGWSVENFMSIKSGRVEFDDQNIINFKGYNDSGKSAMLRALDVLFYNIKPTKQVDFIHDDATYFRIIANFDDGVMILRDKYSNGQSLYEMYKDGALIFTTKNGNTLTRITEVPKPIQDYLGLITWDKIAINSRSCWEPLLLADTKGSENYQMLNTALMSEEIAVASNLLNTDKNRLAQDINRIDYELQATKQLCATGSKLTEGIVTDLKDADKALDLAETKSRELSGIVSAIQVRDSVIVAPEVESVDPTQLFELSAIASAIEAKRGIPDIPEVETVDTERIDILTAIDSEVKALDSIKITPELCIVDHEKFDFLAVVSNLVESLKEVEHSIADCEAQAHELAHIIADSEQELKAMGIRTIKCPNCGETIVADELEHHVSGGF